MVAGHDRCRGRCSNHAQRNRPTHREQSTLGHAGARCRCNTGICPTLRAPKSSASIVENPAPEPCPPVCARCCAARSRQLASRSLASTRAACPVECILGLLFVAACDLRHGTGLCRPICASGSRHPPTAANRGDAMAAGAGLLRGKRLLRPSPPALALPRGCRDPCRMLLVCSAGIPRGRQQTHYTSRYIPRLTALPHREFPFIMLG